ncbi:hypothetical protein C8N26_2431 [Tenacibaculum lutimaris]|uniref:Peptidase M1 membrane alanine aminopeptidase domain-containing protein n=1 Tax=Tenacibaculum lutimaris TaxID=285258 RepID=A0A420DZC7_9FLAO|nr:hypothetical protein [Tenacibaculum lutimaris]RKF03057.1 hypothetical protein C8N26_2431 [Tenacibaculum lutimaris]
MKQSLLIALLLTIPLINILAQEKTPILTGKVEISITEGTFECDLTLSEIPHIEDYFIRLNSGMNILHMRSKKPNDFLIYYSKSLNDSLSTGESNAYFFKNNSGKGKFLPESVQFKYVGKFPVVKDTIENYSRKDWKGNIAFNRNSVRSDGRQSAWYPILYDITNDKVLEKIKYNIELTCSDCNTLYMNGNKPIKAQSYNFKSESPQELTLFCGNYDFAELNNTYFLNSGLDNEEVEEFGELINSYKNFYSKNLNISFEQPVSFVQTTPISKKDGWMFVSYPTIMSIGWKNSLKNIVEPKYQNFYRPFIAHELGHFYFGTFKVFNSELGDMMSEGFSEFLSLQLTKKFIGEDVYKEKVNEKIKNLEKFNATPFAKIKSDSEYNNRQLYVYNYAPIIFLAIKKEIGENEMWKWLNRILIKPTKFTDYNFLISTLQQTLKNEKELNTLKTKYFESDKSLENAIKKIETE